MAPRRLRGASLIVRGVSEDEEYLTPAEVGRLFRVDPKTVTRWASQINPQTGKPKLSSIRTPGGHRRFPKAEIDAMIKATRISVTDDE